MALYPKRLPPHFNRRDLLLGGMVTPTEAMALMGRSRRTIYNLMEDEKLPFVIQPGLRGRRIPREACRILNELQDEVT